MKLRNKTLQVLHDYYVRNLSVRAIAGTNGVTRQAVEFLINRSQHIDAALLEKLRIVQQNESLSEVERKYLNDIDKFLRDLP
jgi:predicted DNA-binding protein YlxM (UPF0122 family)